jgi:hypothetical protein
MKPCTVNDSAQDDESPKQDIYARITAKIVAALEGGVRPWVRRWNVEHAAARITRPLRHNGQPYTGINILSLWASASVQGFAAPIWMTYRQAVELGAHVRKGEKGSPVVYTNSITRNVTDADSGVDVARDIHFLKGYTVFNVEQIDGLTVTRSGLVHAVHRAARQAAPTYDAQCTRVRGSPMVSPDETGWKVAGRLQWLWAFATPDTTVYRIQPGRGFEEAAAVLGADFTGVLVRDGWAPYRQFTAAAHQTCLAHLLRRCRMVAADHPHTTFGTDVQTILQQALTVRDRYHAGVVSPHGLAVARGQLIIRLAARLDRPSRVPDVQRFAAHLWREFTAVWSFLFAPTIDASN